ncbi:WXG100 family type VII secretion target [Nocardia sp. NPDC049149]|uniref:WXG100 family type VII secretion target n=1 Tax=Nocardia sp. NPDC049149 TaxID=3364315 RepID=UPI0037217AA6
MAGEDRFRVDLEQLDAAITTMDQFGQDVEELLGEVDRHVADLHLSWSSEAATAQRAAHDRWVAGVEEMRENLDELRVVAAKAHRNYAGAIDVNTRMWPA